MTPDKGDVNAERDLFAELISPVSADEFFTDTWQKKPRLFLAKDAPNGEATRPIPQQSWSDCCDLLLLGTGACGAPPDGFDLLLFKNQEITHRYDDSGPFGALLDGASCAVNHAEFVFPPFSDLCLGLRRRLLHVYANCYITPAQAQAVNAHADDRDVFILQLRGSKHWKVYADCPVKLPYTQEQVGKNGMPVPEETLKRPPLIETTLHPGDVLYMPRGYVHEASCSSQSSWHVTLAVATHDWSWTKAVAAMASRTLDREADARFRTAVPLSLGLTQNEAPPERDVQLAQGEMAAILEKLQTAFSIDNLSTTLTDKLRSHNSNQERCIAGFKSRMVGAGPRLPALWRLKPITLGARIRATTKEERLNEADSCGRRQRGLIVRDEVAGAVTDSIAALRRRGSEGALVSELGGPSVSKEEAVIFDDLMKISLARLCVFHGVMRIVATACDDRSHSETQS